MYLHIHKGDERRGTGFSEAVILARHLNAAGSGGALQRGARTRWAGALGQTSRGARGGSSVVLLWK